MHAVDLVLAMYGAAIDGFADYYVFGVSCQKFRLALL